METITSATSIRVPWNKGKLVGQKAPFNELRHAYATANESDADIQTDQEPAGGAIATRPFQA